MDLGEKVLAESLAIEVARKLCALDLAKLKEALASRERDLRDLPLVEIAPKTHAVNQKTAGCLSILVFAITELRSVLPNKEEIAGASAEMLTILGATSNP